MSDSYDAIIVGAGPAGCISSLLLARSSFNVLLLDKAYFPRDKTCGEGITPRAINLLTRLGLDHLIRNYPRIDKVMISAPGRNPWITHIPEINQTPSWGVVVPRREFDAKLLAEAKRAGINVIEGIRVIEPYIENGMVAGVIGFKDKEKVVFKAKLVIAADGAYSCLKRRIFGSIFGKNLDHAFAVRAIIAPVQIDLPDTIEFHFKKEILPMYGWFFPIAPDKANVGIGVAFSRKKDRCPEVKRLFNEFLNDEKIKSRMKLNSVIGSLKGHHIPLGGSFSKLVYPGIIFVGDAGGFANPFTGEGISYAMESAEIGAKVVEIALNRKDFSLYTLKIYPTLCKERFGRNFRLSRALRFIFSSPLLLDGFAKMAKKRLHRMDAIAQIFLSSKPRFPLRFLLP